MDSGLQELKTKIVCTIGPACRDADTLRRMAEAGMVAARINSGHCDVEEVREYVQTLDTVGEASGRRVARILDLQGPRIRVGSIRGSSVQLKSGQPFIITSEQKRGDETRVSVPYPGLAEDVKPGDSVLIGDGLIRMRVDEVAAPELRCTVIEGGTLQQGKGMNFPDSALKLEAFTDRDRRYLEAGLESGIDWVAQSFIRDARDVSVVKDAIREMGSSVPVMAKIEKGEAVENIGSIIEASDGIMVARGDLGVEMELADVPIIQKELIARAVRSARPVVTATQMLESMMEHPRPTRAEASDVANAILDGTDAIMLSGETAIGQYPVEAVEMMARIASHAERALDYGQLLERGARWGHANEADAISYAACKIAADLGAKAIVTITRSGYTARLVARYRPAQPILAASPDKEVVDRLSLVWGVRGAVVPQFTDMDKAACDISGTCLDEGIAAKGDLVIITGGFLHEESGTTNLVHVHKVG